MKILNSVTQLAKNCTSKVFKLYMTFWNHKLWATQIWSFCHMTNLVCSDWQKCEIFWNIMAVFPLNSNMLKSVLHKNMDIHFGSPATTSCSLSGREKRYFCVDRPQRKSK